MHVVFVVHPQVVLVNPLLNGTRSFFTLFLSFSALVFLLFLLFSFDFAYVVFIFCISFPIIPSPIILSQVQNWFTARQLESKVKVPSVTNTYKDESGLPQTCLQNDGDQSCQILKGVYPFGSLKKRKKCSICYLL